MPRTIRFVPPVPLSDITSQTSINGFPYALSPSGPFYLTGILIQTSLDTSYLACVSINVHRLGMVHTLYDANAQIPSAKESPTFSLEHNDVFLPSPVSFLFPLYDYPPFLMFCPVA